MLINSFFCLYYVQPTFETNSWPPHILHNLPLNHGTKVVTILYPNLDHFDYQLKTYETHFLLFNKSSEFPVSSFHIHQDHYY